jgi:hypothetical protein
MNVKRLARVVLAAILVAFATAVAHAGSTEPALAIARVTAVVEDGTVTLDVTANYDYGDVVRLGYPVTIVVTTADAVARLALDGSVTLASGGGAPTPVPAARGVVAIAPDHLTAVLSPTLTAAGTATVRLEATFDHSTLRSNSVEVQW